MLDIGFGELLLIGAVALVVIGPKRLPHVARTAGHMLGRFQRYVAEVKADINREIEMSELKSIQSSVEEAARSVERTVKSEMADAEQQLRSAETEIAKAGEEFKQAQTEINQSFALPHMGTMRAGAASDVPPDLAGATSAPNVELGVKSDIEPAEAPVPGSEGEPSPQLELGLQAPPPAGPAPEPRQPA